MNYLYQFPGVDNNCTPAGNGVLDYSYGVRPNLNEASLNELVGVCGSTSSPWDWNGNGVIGERRGADLNNDGWVSRRSATTTTGPTSTSEASATSMACQPPSKSWRNSLRREGP